MTVRELTEELLEDCGEGTLVLPSRNGVHCGVNGEVEVEHGQEEDGEGNIIDAVFISGFSRG